VGIVQVFSDATNAGWGPFLDVLIVVNIGLGVLNMLPMLPLDGGHVAIATYERLRSRKGRPYHADVSKLTPVIGLFVAALGVLFLLTVYLDITHPAANPFH
jgi:membrane-associated protease RseP (regulator of RpoE activity)